MAIQPPSDIVLDVAQAVDPARLQAAAEKLARIAAGKEASTDSFAAVMNATRRGSAPGTGAASPATVLSNLQRRATAVVGAASHTAEPADAQAKAYQGLEAVLLQTYVEAMLPRNEGFFGDAASGDTGRFFLSQQLANQLAQSGSLGIAKSLSASHAPAGSQHVVGTVAAAPLSLTVPHFASQRKL